MAKNQLKFFFKVNYIIYVSFDSSWWDNCEYAFLFDKMQTNYRNISWIPVCHNSIPILYSLP